MSRKTFSVINNDLITLKTSQWFEKKDLIINPVHITGLFLYPLKTSENHSFSDIYSGFRKTPEAWNRLRKQLHYNTYNRYCLGFHSKYVTKKDLFSNPLRKTSNIISLTSRFGNFLLHSFGLQSKYFSLNPKFSTLFLVLHWKSSAF